MSIIIIYVFGCLYGLSVNVVLAVSEIGISYLQEKAKQTVKKAEKKLEDMMTNDWWQPSWVLKTDTKFKEPSLETIQSNILNKQRRFLRSVGLKEKQGTDNFIKRYRIIMLESLTIWFCCSQITAIVELVYYRWSNCGRPNSSRKEGCSE